MTISINEITSGRGIRLDNNIFIITEYHHVKPGKGSAFVRVKLRNMKTDAVIERTFKTADKLEDIFLEEKVAQYLYHSGDLFHFMDQETFEEILLTKKHMSDVINYLQDNLTVTIVMHKRKPLKVILPNFLTAQITETEPGVRGDSARAGTKPAKIDTGAVVQVPLFIGTGDWIKVDTRNSQYVERVKK